MALALQISIHVAAKPYIALATAGVSRFHNPGETKALAPLLSSSSHFHRGGRVQGRFGSSFILSATASTLRIADALGGSLPGYCREGWRKLLFASLPQSVSTWKGHRGSLFWTKGRDSRRSTVTMSAAGGTSKLTSGPPAAKTIILHPSVKHTTTIVWLHGLGDTGTGWANLLEILALPHIKWVVPTAPVQPVTINGGYPSTAWFDIRGLTPDAPEDVEGIERSAAYILELLREEQVSDGQAVKVAIGGLSQGGALSLYLATRLALGTWSNGTPVPPLPLAGAVCLSGWLPQARSLGVASPAAAAKASAISILICHGDADPLIPSLFGELSHQALKLFGFSNSQFKRYKGLGHEVGGEEMSDLRDWLLANFPPPK